LPDLSDKGVMGRLQHMGDWLAHVLAVLLTEKFGKGAGRRKLLIWRRLMVR